MGKKKNNNLSFLFILLMFICAGAVSWNLYFRVYSQADTVSIHSFPDTIADWVAEELPITDDEKAILETDNVFVRRYTNAVEDKEVYLFIVYSQNNRKVSHPPEVCYIGSGVTILGKEPDQFLSPGAGAPVMVNRVTVEKKTFKQIFLYWFKVGDSFTPDYWKQQVLIALKSFLGQPSSSALIRVSSDVKDGNVDGAVATTKEFSQLIQPLLYQYLP